VDGLIGSYVNIVTNARPDGKTDVEMRVSGWGNDLDIDVRP
jgi:hypothetical protein